jgi:peptidoglycan/xylan/chitin deacetylase (PgdA/CDA1 family)
MIHRTPFFLPWLYPSLVWRIPTAAKELFLTFDDGPVPGPTEFVLDELAKRNCRATFFCIGDNVRKHPQIFEKVVAAGHAVGNHTFNHLKGWSTARNAYAENIRMCDEAIRQVAPEVQRVSMFRPPYGRITRAQIDDLAAYKIIMWDTLTMDYKRSLSPLNCLRESIRATRNGSIIVFHDSLKAERNMTYSLPRYLDYFLEQGYSFNRLPA